MKALTMMMLLFLSPPAGAVVFCSEADSSAVLELGAGFTGVGRVVPDGGCTLIEPAWAITAAHVARQLEPGSTLVFGDTVARVKRIVFHPESKSPGPHTPPKVDMALVELEAPVAGVDPVTLYSKQDEQGKEITIVGHGDYGAAEQTLHYTDLRRRAVRNVVDDAGPLRLFMAFDAPPEGTENEGVGAPGDSGGAALLEENGEWFLVGVSSGSMNGKPNEYGVIDVYARVSTQIEWIRKVLAN